MAAFRGWADALPDAEVLFAQLPGRDGRLRESAAVDLRQRAAGIVGALAAYGERPLVVYGHSMGAIVAFEVARQLTASGAPPIALVVSGRRGPTRPDPLPPVSHLPMEEFIDEIQARYSAIPAVVLADSELRDVFLPMLREDIAALERYGHAQAEPLPCPVFAYGGAADPHSSRADLEAWASETRSAFTLRLFPGGHFFIQAVRDQFLATMSNDLRAACDAIRSPA